MFRGRLQSGFLLFETQQGLVRVELSLRQRIYLLWTFRNFRQLSVPLLNARQRTMVNALFLNKAGVLSHSYNRWDAIGLVENFVPPKVQIDVSRVQQEERRKEFVARRSEIGPQPARASSSSPRSAGFKRETSKIATSRLAATFGALLLCILSAGAWQRMQAVSGSKGHDRRRLQQIDLIALPNSPPSAKSAAIAEPVEESPTANAPPPAPGPPLAPDSEAKPAASQIAAMVPTPAPTPKRMTRVHEAASPVHLPLSGQDSSIQASRAPLRFAYPVCTGVRARGVVALTARVDSDGTVRTVRVASGNRALAAAAVRAVRQWRYRPYIKDGQPVATETNIVISFISDDAISMSFPSHIAATR